MTCDLECKIDDVITWKLFVFYVRNPQVYGYIIRVVKEICLTFDNKIYCVKFSV